ncbi:TPA: AAA family ATPase [Streptococcus suis]|nr:AAA family ATPase [Streptococcus suis]
MKIKKILLYNFKNFRYETIIDFSNNITFLVGPNGFGKTTIFDAIELGLTGNISRINTVTGENIAYNKPFFQNDITKPVVIKLWLEKTEAEKLIVVRKLTNSIPSGGKVFAPKKSTSQFELFQQEEITEDKFNSIEDISLSAIQQSFIDEFLGLDGKYEIDKIFNLFNYIQQEETTFFLKQTEQKRSDSLSFLVKTDKVEEKIKNIDKVISAITKKLNILTKEQEDFTQQELNNIPYQRLFNHQYFQFDKDKPFSVDNLSQLDNFKATVQEIIKFKQNFSISEYQKKLERDGRRREINNIDNALRFAILSPLIQRPNHQWQWEKYVVENSILFEYVLLENYLQTFETIDHDFYRRSQLNNYLTTLSLDITQMTVQSFKYVENDRLANDFKLLKSQIVHYQSLKDSVSQVDKNLSDLRQFRYNLDDKFNELRHQHVDERKCPFCNSQFQSFEDLTESYHGYEHYLISISSQNSQQLQEVQTSINSFVHQLKQKITDEIESLSSNIDESLLARLQELRNRYVAYHQNIDAFKTFIQSYTNITPYPLGRLSFDTYNQQYQFHLRDFQSKLFVDKDIYSLVDDNNPEIIRSTLEELRNDFSELLLETYQLEPVSNSKISKIMLDSRVYELKKHIYSMIDNKYAVKEDLIADAQNIFSAYFQNQIDLLENIRIQELEQKKLYLDIQHKLVQNQQFQNLSHKINTLQKTVERLEEVNAIYKEEVKVFKIDIVRQLRIPFFIYSAKMLQNYQQGLGIFLTYKKAKENTEEKAIIRFKSDPKNDHDAMNQLSTGQLAVVSLAFTLSLNTIFKLSDNLNFLMIDDPIQDMDAMNVLSFIEILRHGIIDSYQIILSTYSDHNALFMGYKFANSNSQVDIKYKNVRELQI